MAFAAKVVTWINKINKKSLYYWIVVGLHNEVCLLFRILSKI